MQEHKMRAKIQIAVNTDCCCRVYGGVRGHLRGARLRFRRRQQVASSVQLHMGQTAQCACAPDGQESLRGMPHDARCRPALRHAEVLPQSGIHPRDEARRMSIPPGSASPPTRPTGATGRWTGRTSSEVRVRCAECPEWHVPPAGRQISFSVQGGEYFGTKTCFFSFCAEAIAQFR